MANTAELTIVLKADGSGLTGTVRVSADEVRKLGIALDDTGGKAERAGRKIDDAGKTAERFGKLAGAAAAAVAAGYLVMTRNAINAADQVFVVSQRLGMSAEALSTFQAGARQNGVEVSQLNGYLETFANTATRAAGGAKQQAQLFRDMGIAVRDANGQFKSIDTLLPEVAAKFASYREGPDKAALANKLFGDGASALIPMLNQLGDQGFDKAREAAEQMGLVIDTQTANAAHELHDQIDALQMVTSAYFNRVARDVLPNLVLFAQGLNDQAREASSANDKTTILGNGIRSLITWLIEAYGWVQRFGVGLADAFAKAGLELEKLKTRFTDRGYLEAFAGAMRGDPLAIAAVKALDQALEDKYKPQQQALQDAADQGFAAIDANVKRHVANISRSIGDMGSAAESAGQTLRAGSAPVAEYGNAAADAARQVREAERSERARTAALTALDRIIGDLGGKLDPLAAAEDHHADALRQIAAESAKALREGASYAEVQGKVATATDLAEAAHRREIAALRDKAGVAGAPDILKAVRDNAAYEQSLLRMTARQRAFAEAQKAAGEYFKQNETLFVAAGVSINQYVEAQANATVATFDVGQQAAELEAILSRFDDLDFGTKLSGQLKLVQKALKEMLDLGPPTKEAMEQIERVNRALAAMRKEQINPNTAAFLNLGQAVVTGMKGAAEEGSRTMAALEIASAGIALTQGILAILTQGQGEPYSAFARMAAMAALVIPLAAQAGAAISMAGGAGFSDTAAERQAAQGTGTVLGDAEAKSESIARATEITANASEQLVGLNRGMLNALLNLQDALGAAGNQLARGAADAEFGNLAVAQRYPGGASGSIVDPFGWLGGKSKITDEGIIIFGGALTEMLESIAVGAYQEVQSRSWAFGSTHTREGIVDVSDEFGRQFQLVIGSIVDTVREGALALGLLPEDVEAALAAYRVEEIRISLKDLSAEEQQAELEAVFSQMFDGLAGAVVPFIAQFQQVGEGLGETLVRVATGVQVTQEAVRQLGIVIDETDPERFAQISEGLIAAVGGIDAFISGMQSFVGAFAGEEQQFQVASAALASAFEQVGLTVPDTRQGMWALMQTLDATTESGREQIATLLRLADVADQYYDLLEGRATAQADYARFIADLGQEGSGVGTVSSLAAMRLEIQKWEQETILRADELARAAGLQGIAEQDLILIRQIAEDRIIEAIAMIEEASRELVDRLWGDASEVEDSSSSASGSLRRFSGAIGDTARAAQSAAQLLLGALSPLNDQQKLQYAIGAYQRGTVSREDVLQIGRRLYASSQAYEDLFNMLQGMPGGLREAGGGGGNFAGDAATQERERTAAELEAEQRQRRGDAQLLAQNVASLANVQKISYQQVADTLGFGLGQLATELGLSQEDLITYLDNLVAMENAVPNTIAEGTDRIVAALYDIAGMPVPGDFAREGRASAEYPYRHSTRANPYGDAPPPPRNRGEDRGASTGGAALRDDRRTSDSVERLIDVTLRGNEEVVAAVRENVSATRGVDASIRDRRAVTEAGTPRSKRTPTQPSVRR